MIIAILYSGILLILSFYLWYYLPFILFVMLLIFFKYKTIEIEIINDWINIKWKVFNVTYRKRKKKFDTYKIDGDIITLWSNGIQEIKFDIGLAVEETEITSMTIWIGNKFYTVGNKKNAQIIFNQIKEAL